MTFTSGATEAAALALTPDLVATAGEAPATRLLLGATEHPAVVEGHRFSRDRVETIPVDGAGLLDLGALEAALVREPGRAVLALQGANGETGVIQPVAAAADLVHARGGLLAATVRRRWGASPVALPR